MLKKNEGFTLIELLAVIVILGLLLAIAIPSVTRYISSSKKKTLTTTIGKYIDAGIMSVNNGDFVLNENNVIYAIPIECIPMERNGTNPFGEWLQVNNEYWAYVLIQYDENSSEFTYGFTFKDSSGYGLYPITYELMEKNGKDVRTELEVFQPRTGLVTYFVSGEH